MILNAAVSADAALVGAARRRNPEVTVGMHICRGNNRIAWMAQGSYEPVAERLFGDVGVDRFRLEYDTERAGGFAPLRYIRRSHAEPAVRVCLHVPGQPADRGRGAAEA